MYSSVEHPDFLANVNVFAHELPIELRRFLNQFRLADEGADYIVISGFDIDDADIGPTPPHWDNRPALSPTLREEIYMMLVCALLGDAFGWATQQGGYVCHDILPVKGLEFEQVGASSECVLGWHVEDAFHPLRGDHVALLCLRNPDTTATTVGALDLTALPEHVIDVLFDCRFEIKPDHSHTPEFRGRDGYWHDRGRERLELSYAAMQTAQKHPGKIPILSGRREQPFLCVDPVYMDHPIDDREGTEALEALIDVLDRNLQDVVLRPGDLAILDNGRVVHGRQPFSARFDGTDRWLKRLNLTTDLRKSHIARGGESRRLIF